MDVHTDRLNINGDWKLPEKILPSDWSSKNVMIAARERPTRYEFPTRIWHTRNEMIDSAEDRKVYMAISLLCVLHNA